MDTVDHYSHLWDGSQTGWVLLHMCRQVARLGLCFSEGGPTPREIAAVRASVPAFSVWSSSEVYAEIKGKVFVLLGEFASSEARHLAERCRKAGLSVESVAVDASSYLPFNEESKSALIIEDDGLARAVYRKAIDLGVRVVEMEG